MDLHGRNTALIANPTTVNGRTADIAITARGSDLYFAISGAMGAAGFIFLFASLFRPRRDRLFHYICTAIVFTASIAYFTMGSNLGFTPIGVEFHRPSRPIVRGRYREIFYVRYIDWFITTPLLLLDLLLTAGIPWPKIIFVMFVDWFMIIMGLVGALIQSRYKFAYFAVGCFALFYIIYELAWTARRRAATLGSDVSRVFLACGVLTLVLWIVYPIAWGLCEGGNYLAPDSEAIFYSVLDFVAKIVFSAILLFGHRNIDPARLGVAIRDYDRDPGYYRSLHGMEEGDKGPGGARIKGQSVSSDGTRVERSSEGCIARDRAATNNAGLGSKKRESSPAALASGSYPRPSGAPPDSAAAASTTTSTHAAPGIVVPAVSAPGAAYNAAAGATPADVPATTPATASAAASTTTSTPAGKPTTAAPGIVAPAVSAPGAVDNAAAGTTSAGAISASATSAGATSPTAPATTPATASAATASQKQTALPTSPQKNTRSSYIPRPSRGNGKAADRAAAVKSVPERVVAAKSSPEKAAAAKSLPEKAGATKSSPEKAVATKGLPEKAAATKSLPEKAATTKSSLEGAVAARGLPEKAAKSLPEKAAATRSSPERAATTKSVTEGAATARGSSEKGAAAKGSTERTVATAISKEGAAASRGSLDKTEAARKSPEKAEVASSSPPTVDTFLLPKLTANISDTAAKANEAVDATIHPDEVTRPKTYADAIRAATHGAVGGGDHAT